MIKRRRKYEYGDMFANAEAGSRAASPYYSDQSLNSLSLPENTNKQSFFNSQKGQGLGVIANAAAQAIPGPQNSAQTESEEGVDKAGTAIASAIGPWWGALAKVGTTASKYVRQDDNVSHAQGFVGDTLNPFHQFSSLKDGRALEKWQSFVNPVGSAHLAASRRKTAFDTKKLIERTQLAGDSEKILADYPVNGVGAYGMKFPNGGRLPYPTDDSDVNQLASNVAQYEGDTHSEGGIPLDTNQDKQPEIEVEDKEVIKDDMVLSNRLKPSREVRDVARKLGLSIKKKETYATLAARIGKKKGDFEEKLKSTRPGEKTTAEIMTNRLDATIDMLFMDQQVRKHGKSNGPKYPGGGILPRVNPNAPVAGPVYAQQDPRTSIEQNESRAVNNLFLAQRFKNIVAPSGLVASSDYNAVTNQIGLGQQQVGGGARNYVPVDPMALQRADSVISAGRPFLAKRPQVAIRANGGFIPKFPLGGDINAGGTITNPFTKKKIANTYNPNLVDPAVPNYVDKYEQRGFDIGDYKTDIAAGLGTIANQISIGKMETQYNPDIVDAPMNQYTDRTGFLTSNAEQQFTAASRGINNSSSQDNIALKSNLYAKHIGGLNQALDQEALRKDQILGRYNELVNRTNLINNNTKNVGKLTSMENRNKKRALTQANIDNLIRSEIGNESIRDFKSIEYTKNYLDATKSGERGVSERYIADLDPKVRRKLGFK